MLIRSLVHTARLGLAGLAVVALATPAPAYLFWAQPALKGVPVTGGEPGIAVPLPGATPEELKANLLWSMRAGLNVAALQCQFAPGLMTVSNYNGLLHQHAAELDRSFDRIGAYFKRTAGKAWQTKLDEYLTRTFNGYSTMYAQLSFCETAALIGREALTLPAGQLNRLAAARMREFRNSLVPTGDAALGARPADLPLAPFPAFACVNAKGKTVKCG